jgi:hypothetical protein
LFNTSIAYQLQDINSSNLKFLSSEKNTRLLPNLKTKSILNSLGNLDTVPNVAGLD